jgi:hypothetical protein
VWTTQERNKGGKVYPNRSKKKNLCTATTQGAENRVARWIVCFQTQNPKFGLILDGH